MNRLVELCVRDTTAMKSKLLLCLALVLSGCFYSRTAHAYVALIPLNRTNIATTAPFLRIVSTHYGLTNNPITEFSVFVLLKNKSDVETTSGILTVKDAQQKDSDTYIVNTLVQSRKLPGGVTSIPKSWAGKCIVFRFAVATRLLGNSDFCVEQMDDPKFPGGGEVFEFNLQEFADEK
jgi:hypothetical protein